MLFIGIVAGFSVGIVATWCAALWYLPEAAYAQGRRDALRRAIELAADRADVAVQVSPPGALQLGLARAQALHGLQLELAEALTGPRPVKRVVPR